MSSIALINKHLSPPLTPESQVESISIPIKPTLTAQQSDFRQAMSCLAAAVNIITTDGEGGKSGFTASAVCSVTDTPPTLLICLNRHSSVYATFKANQVLCVNTLAEHQRDLSQLFSSKIPMQQRFEQDQWHTLTTGAPVLKQAAVAFDCKISSIQQVGTHDVFFCEVLATQQSQDVQGLVYFNRNYHRLQQHD